MLKFEDWGLIPYEQALNRQLDLVENIFTTQAPGVLVFCSHPPIVTLGRKTQEGDVFGWDGDVQEVSRGGRATYHGPSQLVVYPIVNMELPGLKRKAKDIGSLLRFTEDAIVSVLSHYGVSATGKTFQANKDTQETNEETGVWIGNQKIASLGFAIKKWISYHGAAINLDEDSRAFYGMKPCGFSRETMVSLEKISEKQIVRNEFSEFLKAELLSSL